MITISVFLRLIAVLVDLFGITYPVIPGLGLMFGGAWLPAYAGDYQIYSTNTLTFTDITAAFGMAMDYVSDVLGAEYIGTSKQAL